MIELVVLICTVILAFLVFLSLYRAYLGPSAADRIVAINVITSKVVAIIVLIALLTGQGSYVNVALVYAMVGFSATIAVSKYLHKGKVD